jgi:hypothetical protein
LNFRDGGADNFTINSVQHVPDLYLFSRCARSTPRDDVCYHDAPKLVNFKPNTEPDPLPQLVGP